MKDLKPRFERTFFDEPSKPIVGETKFKISLLTSTGDRYNHYPNAEDGYEEDEEDEDHPENCGSFGRQALSLKEINKLVKEHHLDPKDVVITASLDDDYIMIEAVHVKKLSEEEKEQQYQEDWLAWRKQETERAAEEEKRIKWELESLQRRMDALKNKQ